MTKVVKMTNREILENATKRLDKAGIAEAGNDAWLLFSEAFGMTRTDYLIDKNAECNAGHIPFFDSCIEKRLAHIPVQYILGKAYFMGYEFEVNNNVLIPRFDTEVLVSEVLKYTQDDFKILDICTGSGCIAISLSLLSGAEVTGVDISEKALAVADYNKVINKADKVTFVKSNMFENIDGAFNLIVSNPPYIPTKDIFELEHEVKNEEPMLALNGHDDGLFFYRILAEESAKYLRHNGGIFMEIGYNQAEDVRNLLIKNNFTDISVIKDLAGLDRVVCGWRK